jgi:Na+-transporting methylmalonyl-CoA/oxaloacetate decarboxylase gamma subunit
VAIVVVVVASTITRPATSYSNTHISTLKHPSVSPQTPTPTPFTHGFDCRHDDDTVSNEYPQKKLFPSGLLYSSGGVVAGTAALLLFVLSVLVIVVVVVVSSLPPEVPSDSPISTGAASAIPSTAKEVAPVVTAAVLLVAVAAGVVSSSSVSTPNSHELSSKYIHPSTPNVLSVQ